MKIEENMRQIYDMIDGIPIWRHLKSGATENKIKLIGADYGKFAEILGQRILDKLTENGGILEEICPEIDIVSIQSSPRTRISSNAKIELGDLILEISYKDNSGNFGKKVVIFEIKHGRFQVEQNQLRRYCSMINNPGEYFPKADEIKVIFMMFDKINTNKCSASYIMRELSKDLADKILKNSPLPIIVHNSDINPGINPCVDPGINPCVDPDVVVANISEGLKMITD